MLIYVFRWSRRWTQQSLCVAAAQPVGDTCRVFVGGNEGCGGRSLTDKNESFDLTFWHHVTVGLTWSITCLTSVARVSVIWQPEKRKGKCIFVSLYSVWFDHWALFKAHSWDLVHVLTICGVTVEIVWFNLFRHFDKHMHNLRYWKWHCGRCRVWLRINRWGLYSVSIVI